MGGLWSRARAVDVYPHPSKPNNKCLCQTPPDDGSGIPHYVGKISCRKLLQMCKEAGIYKREKDGTFWKSNLCYYTVLYHVDLDTLNNRAANDLRVHINFCDFTLIDFKIAEISTF